MEFKKTYYAGTYNEKDFNNYLLELVEKHKPKTISVSCYIGKYDFFTKTTQMVVEFDQPVSLQRVQECKETPINIE